MLKVFQYAMGRRSWRRANLARDLRPAWPWYVSSFDWQTCFVDRHGEYWWPDKDGKPGELLSP